jgi:hypothetical protein
MYWSMTGVRVRACVRVCHRRLEENQVRTDCGLRTLETDGIPDYHFRAVPILNKAIMKVHALRR